MAQFYLNPMGVMPDVHAAKFYDFVHEYMKTFAPFMFEIPRFHAGDLGYPCVCVKIFRVMACYIYMGVC